MKNDKIKQKFKEIRIQEIKPYQKEIEITNFRLLLLPLFLYLKTVIIST